MPLIEKLADQIQELEIPEEEPASTPFVITRSQLFSMGFRGRRPEQNKFTRANPHPKRSDGTTYTKSSSLSRKLVSRKKSKAAKQARKRNR